MSSAWDLWVWLECIGVVYGRRQDFQGGISMILQQNFKSTVILLAHARIIWT